MISWINFHLRAVVSLLTAAENTVARNFARHGDFGDCAVSGDDLVVVDVGCTGGHAFSLSEIRAKASWPVVWRIGLPPHVVHKWDNCWGNVATKNSISRWAVCLEHSGSAIDCLFDAGQGLIRAPRHAADAVRVVAFARSSVDGSHTSVGVPIIRRDAVESAWEQWQTGRTGNSEASRGVRSAHCPHWKFEIIQARNPSSPLIHKT